jgi:hypothetical protein
MPYIKPEFRKKFKSIENSLDEVTPTNAGELNYIFTRIINRYIKALGENYQAYNDLIGALEGAKLEMYRRKISPYENIKITENGDL